MANIKSAKKRILVIEKKTLRNKMIKSKVKTAISKFEKNLALGDLDASKKSFISAIKELDKAASKGIFHKNTVARKKSRLAAKLNAATKTMASNE